MQWPIWIYLAVVFAIMAIPGFFISLLLARFFKLSQTGGYLISFSIVILIIAVACIIDRSFAYTENVFFAALISIVSIRIGSKIGLRLRMKKLGESHADEDK